MFTRLFAVAILVSASAAIPAVAARPLGAFGPVLLTAGAAAQTPAVKQVGTIKAINGNTITLATDGGGDVEVTVTETTRIVRVEPGQKDLSGATAMALKDLQVGDRILVRGHSAGDAKSLVAAGIIAMKHADVDAKKQQEREDWQKHGIGGLVSAVDPAAGIIRVSVGAAGATKEVAVHVSKSTIIRHYAPDSVKFDDARPGTLEEIKAGDQLRARGTRSADGSEFTAVEIVSGSFRNIAGTLSSIDASANTISVMDLITKQPVVVKLSAESQVRKLTPEMAQHMAARLKAAAGGGAPGAPAGAAPVHMPGQESGPAKPSEGERPAPGGRQSSDLQQLLNRLPQATLADLQKGDAVMIVSTEGSASGQVTAITLLAGVEPLLTASPRGAQGMTLSPWSLGGEGAGGGDASP